MPAPSIFPSGAELDALTPSPPSSPHPNPSGGDPDQDGEAEHGPSPPRENADEQESTAPQDGSSAPSTSRKRPARDLGQTVNEAARKMRLTDAGKQAVFEIMKKDPEEREVYHLALQEKTQEVVEAIQPAKAAWTIPSDIETFLDKTVMQALASASLSAYVVDDIVVSIVMRLFEKRAMDFGIKDFKKSEAKRAAVRERIRAKATHRRNEIKAELKASIGAAAQGTDVRAGAKNILEVCRAVCKIDKTANIGVSMPMLARFAVLRSVYRQDTGTNFWKSVDASLKNLRDDKVAYPTKERRSAAIKIVLTRDRQNYGDFIDDVPLEADGTEDVDGVARDMGTSATS